MKKFSFIFTSVISALFGITLSLHAATFDVTRFDDPAVPLSAPFCPPGNCSLRQAVFAAHESADSTSTVNLPAGNYFLTFTGDDEDLGRTGDLDVYNHSLNVFGAGADQTIVSASGLGDRIFELAGPNDGVQLDIENVTLTSGNCSAATSKDGGAINFPGVMGVDSLILDNVTLSNNHSRSGGAISGSGDISIFNSSLINNLADVDGGAIHSETSATNIAVNNSTLVENTAGTNGGATFTILGADISFRNSTITNNEAAGDGGGVHFGVISSSNLSIENSILANNQATSGEDCFKNASGTVTAENYNVFGDVVSCLPTVDPTDKNNVTDPGLLALDNYGGTMLTELLKEGSPAIDNGNPAGCLDTNGTPITTDQRGQTRPAGAACDSGAVELGEADLSVTKTDDATQTRVGATLVYTVTVKNNGPDIEFNANMQDTLPPEVSFQSVVTQDPTDICSQANGVVSCELGQLNSGDTAVITIGVLVNDNGGGSITNNATVSGSELDPDPSNDTFSLDTPTVGGSGGCAIQPNAAVSRGIWVYGLFALSILALRLSMLRRSR